MLQSQHEVRHINKILHASYYYAQLTVITYDVTTRHYNA